MPWYKQDWQNNRNTCCSCKAIQCPHTLQHIKWPQQLTLICCLVFPNKMQSECIYNMFHLEFTLIAFPLLPLPQRGLGPYSFIIFSFICLVTLVYIWMVVPETKNKTFLEVCQMFAKRNKVEIKLGDGGLPLKESKEHPEDAMKVTAFWRKMIAFRGEEVFTLQGIVIDLI